MFLEQWLALQQDASRVLIVKGLAADREAVVATRYSIDLPSRGRELPNVRDRFASVVEARV